MNIPIKTVRIAIIIVFILMGIAGVVASIYAIGLTAFGVGWAGGNKSFLEILWDWKGLLLLTLYAVIASYGLIKRKKYGIVFGMSLTLCILAYSIYDFGIVLQYGDFLEFGDFTVGFLVLTLSSLILIGLYNIMKSIGHLNKKQFLMGGILTLLVLFSFVFLFN